MDRWEYNYQLYGRWTPAGNPKWRGWKPLSSTALDNLPSHLALSEGGKTGFKIASWYWDQRYQSFRIVGGDGTKHVIRKVRA